MRQPASPSVRELKRPNQARLLDWQVALLLLLLLLYPSSATAVAFAPINCAEKCSSGSYRTISNWTFSTSEMADDPNVSPVGANYNNNMFVRRVVAANKYVKGFGFHHSTFDLEDSWDFLDYGQLGPLSYAGQLTGALTQNWHYMSVSGSMQTTPAFIDFTSDSIISHAGFAIDQAKFCCQDNANGTETTSMETGQRYTGVLLGQDDVVYFSFPTESAAPANHGTLALWGDTTSPNDFDLYIRCNAIPTPTQYDQAGWRIGPKEFMHFSDSSCTYPGIWYVAVHAWRGAGWFNLVKAKHFPSQHRGTIRVGVAFNANNVIPGQLEGLRQNIERGIRQTFAATKGTQYVERVEIYNNIAMITHGTQFLCQQCGTSGGTASCDICYQNLPQSSCPAGCCTSYCCENEPPTSQVIIRNCDFDSSIILAHELGGHKWFGVWDEYALGGAVTRCGHSLMASYWRNNRNYCYSGDRTLDRSPGQPASSEPAVWSKVYFSYYGPRLSPYLPPRTPDNYDYADFDFSGIMGLTVVSQY